LLTVGYVITGKVALLWAVPPGYATPIFPPAGLAAAAMLMIGPATLPGTFLGAFLLNLWNGALMLPATAIAAGSTIQAVVCGTVLRHAVGYPAEFDLARFLILSPVCCLTSATLSLGGLLALGTVLPADFGASWVSWWFGDTVGVLVVLSLMFLIAAQ
jgi:integral membrane sensor domain MASE1